MLWHNSEGPKDAKGLAWVTGSPAEVSSLCGLAPQSFGVGHYLVAASILSFGAAQDTFAGYILWGDILKLRIWNRHGSPFFDSRKVGKHHPC